jgi:hypothetical protein
MSRVRPRLLGLRTMVTAALVAVVPAITSAQQITFTHTGEFGSGSVGQTSFVRRSFTFTSIGNVANRQAFGNGFFINHSSSSIDIAGIGVFNITTGTRTFVNNGNNIVGYSRAGLGGLDLYNGPVTPAFGTWDMTTSIGLFAGNHGLLQWNDIPTIQTNAGQLIFTSDSQVSGTFRAVVGPTVILPEPSTYAMLAVAMSAMAVVMRRRGVGRPTSV